MPETNVDDSLRAANAELRQRIALLDGMLRDHEQARKALQESERRYRRLFESAKDGILILDAETGTVVDVNPFLLHLLGYSYDELYGKHLWEIGIFKDIAASKEAFKALQDNEYIRYEDLPLATAAGKPIAVEFVSNVYLVDKAKVIQCNIRDITARKRIESERTRLMAAIEQAAEAMVITDAHGIILFVNSAFTRTTGFSREEAMGQTPNILKSGKQDKPLYEKLWETISAGETWAGRLVNKRKDGILYTAEMTISPIHDATGRIVNYVAVQRDITEQLRLAAQFQQSQKMEAVGLLAGGVAHDYNNMLCVIIGYTELAMEKVEPEQPLYGDLEEILKAAMRSSDITRQLLAFARKQTIAPLVLDLNENVGSMLKMLRRLIGEDIDLDWRPDSEPCMINMDPMQVGQILANLCVNAKDAIADIGKVIIESGKTVLDEEYCSHHDGFVPGDYVLLTVSDDGCGMEKEVLRQIFDPFFTSKGVGQGTGLGLSTVYGIVKQNDGFINVYSEPGRGSTFRIYLPRHMSGPNDIEQEENDVLPTANAGTVLVVEDEPALLAMSQIMLERLGYHVLSAGTPGAAIELAEKHAGEIQLLITDVVMPEMNGRDLAARLQALYPGMRILFMSGYTPNMIIHRNVLDEGMNFLQKPFSMKELALKVRDTTRMG